MLGSVVNAAVVVAGSLVGALGLRGISDRTRRTTTSAMGLAVVLIGTNMALKTADVFIVILSLVAGGIIGENLRIEERLAGIGRTLEARFPQEGGDFTRGFVTATLIYCVGAMSVMGAVEEGLTGRRDILYAKSLLDGVTSVILSSTMGIGVMFSAIPVLVYQGSISLAAQAAQRFLTEAAVREITATGGLMILGIGMNMLDVTTIPVGNLLPGLAIAGILSALGIHVG